MHTRRPANDPSLFDQAALDRMEARIYADPDLMKIRRCTVEHPFGTIKRMSGGGRFLESGSGPVDLGIQRSPCRECLRPPENNRDRLIRSARWADSLPASLRVSAQPGDNSVRSRPGNSAAQQ